MPPKKRKSKADPSQARKKCKVAKAHAETNGTVHFQHEKTQNDKPCYDAFGTTEILEGILECLPASMIYVAQRVNTRFHNAIASSPRIQNKLFVRIDDKPGAPWTFHQPIGNWIIKFWYLGQASEADSKSEDLLTQVDINPCLFVFEGYRGLVKMNFCSKSKEVLKRGPLVRLPFGRTATLQQIGQKTWQQDSIFRSFISDPHCSKIEVTLCFALGVRRPTMIHVSSVVESDIPLTIGAIISRALTTRGSIRIKWRGDGYTAAEVYERRKGVPRDLMNELKSRSGLEVYFRPRDTLFLLNGTVALTDEERVAIGPRQISGDEIMIRIPGPR